MLRTVVRALYRSLLPTRAKQTLRQWVLFDEPDRPPRVIERFDLRSVLVLAPHMDDEVVGCGGTIRRHVLAGSAVTIVFMTDGRRGDPDLYRRPELSAAAIDEAEQRLVERRKQESAAAAKILGAQDLIFLDGPDGALEVTTEILEQLTEIIRRTDPEVIYLPSVFDAHADHWATNRILDRCLRRAADSSTIIRGYEVWTPLLVNCIANIDDVVNEKEQALNQFASQLPHLDVVNASLGLGRYRAIFAGDRRGFAEAFHECTAAAYGQLMDRFSAKR